MIWYALGLYETIYMLAYQQYKTHLHEKAIRMQLINDRKIVNI